MTYATAIKLAEESHIARSAFCVLKRTWRIGDRLEVSEPEALIGDVFGNDRSGLALASDFFVTRTATDVFVAGSAFAPGGAEFEELVVSVRVGGASKRVAVFGDRVARMRGGRVSFEAPSKVASMPLGWDRAYGGLDARVAWRPSESKAPRTVTAHPGCYPRNPFGRGYVVGSLSDGEFVPLPNLEDPEDRLTPERFFASTPGEWWRQPLPWAFEPLHPLMFPRYSYFMGVSPPISGPDDASMLEVRRGFLRAGYQARWKETPESPVLPGFFQCASHGMVLTDVAAGTPVRFENVHATRPMLSFSVPKEPSVVWEIEGQQHAAPVRLQAISCRPNDELVSFTYVSSIGLPRAFIPGIHKHIPVGVRIDGGAHVPYEAPQPVRERLEEAQRRMMTASMNGGCDGKGA